jgi:hypothetical protein
MVAAIVVAVGLRGWLYAQRLSFWNDEAAVVINVFDRDARHLLDPLDYAQVAPPGFLLVHKLVLGSEAPNEYLLRAPDVLVAVAAVVLFAVAAVRVVGRGASAVMAVALFATASRIIHNSVEVKQYGWDVLASVVLMLFAPAFDSEARRDRPILMGVVAAVLFWFSFPAVFVFGGLWLVGTIRAARVSPPGAVWHVVGLLPAAISFAALFRVTLGQQHDPYLYRFWTDAFPHWDTLPTWLPRQVYSLFEYTCPGVGFVPLGVTVAGAVWFWRCGRREIVLTVLSIVGLALVAAGMQRYPFVGGRVTLYLTPWLFLLAAGSAVRDAWPAWTRGGWAVLPVALVLIVAVPALRQIVRPPVRSTMRPVAQYVRANFTPGETVYLIADGDPKRDRVTGKYLEFLCYWRHPDGPVKFEFPVPGPGREDAFWVVYSCGKREKPALNERLKTIDVEFGRVRETASPLAGAILYRRMAR